MNYGTLYDFETGKAIRPAAADELAKSLANMKIDPNVRFSGSGEFALEGQMVYVEGEEKDATDEVLAALGATPSSLFGDVTLVSSAWLHLPDHKKVEHKYLVEVSPGFPHLNVLRRMKLTKAATPKSPTKVIFVAAFASGAFECDCEDFSFRKTKEPDQRSLSARCKHISAMIRHGWMDEPKVPAKAASVPDDKIPF